MKKLESAEKMLKERLANVERLIEETEKRLAG